MECGVWEVGRRWCLMVFVYGFWILRLLWDARIRTPWNIL